MFGCLVSHPRCTRYTPSFLEQSTRSQRFSAQTERIKGGASRSYVLPWAIHAMSVTRCRAVGRVGSPAIQKEKCILPLRVFYLPGSLVYGLFISLYLHSAGVQVLPGAGWTAIKRSFLPKEPRTCSTSPPFTSCPRHFLNPSSPPSMARQIILLLVFVLGLIGLSCVDACGTNWQP